MSETTNQERDEAMREMERDELAKLVEAVIWTKDSDGKFRYGPETRVALAIAALDVRRGRPLTAAEQLENFRLALEEDPEMKL